MREIGVKIRFQMDNSLTVTVESFIFGMKVLYLNLPVTIIPDFDDVPKRGDD